MAQVCNGCDAAETARRHAVVVRLNVLWDKKQKCDDPKKAKRIDKAIDLVRRQESPWLKEAAFFLY